MDFKEFIEQLHGSESFRSCFAKAAAGDHFAVTGVIGSAASLLISGLSSQHGGQLIVIAADYKTAELLQEDLETICKREINYFPAYRGMHLEDKQINTDIKLARLKCLQNLSLGLPGIYIVEIRTLLHPIVSSLVFKNRTLTLKKGEITDFSLLVNYLIEEGFSRENMVEDFGDISVRGGIIDIFPPSSLEPIRIEFDGNTIESIRIFDINDQCSIRHIDSVAIVPPVIDILGGLTPDLPEDDSSILAHFHKSAAVFLHQPIQAQKTLGEYLERWKYTEEREQYSDEVDSQKTFHKIERLFESRDSAYITNTLTAVTRSDALHFNFKTLPQFGRNLKLFSELFNEAHSHCPNLVAAVFCDNQGQADRLKKLILEDDLLSAKYFVQVGSLSEGFIYPEAELALINDHEIFSRKRFRKSKRIYRARKILFDELSLNIGDYVVHEDYGIGRYLGLEKITIGQSEQEALKIEYRDSDSLYLNIEKLPNLQKYTAKEGYKPELSKLGGADWERLKHRAKKSVQNIAKDLIKLYAKRLSQKGYPFSSDTQWQRELEASFQYDETPDQVKACWDIKKDMESSRPMDRLICGDVGFGKTEVALRAAFKAVNDSKQVAILVPTTILAQQHFETFRERLKQFPVEVEMLSRFRTRKEQITIVDGLQKGIIDIVIGTHRLFSKDVSLKSLGLIIIDEEQRFGVRHKEKLKKLRTEVDILTLTATPIPRTVHMSILGVRDLSVINTPPKNRLPIITEIAQYDDELVRTAIIKELDRGGQIYFVHNRVQTIQKILRKLEKLVPESTFGIAHGQMKEKELENVMLAFLRREFSCLISTMIIESGLDIPTVNTIIINQADNFGLAQLYQLRGRVGRSDIQAFAYLLTPPFDIMTEDSIKRLQTLSEHTELGSGLQIALKDLEIRGAGNLLGVEQSGHINAIGFDMYTRLVKESVEAQAKILLPEEETIPETEEKVSDVKIVTGIAAYLPDYYISDSFQRVSFYRRIALTNSTKEIREIRNDLADRFGSLPVFAENLLKLIHVKILASKLRIERFSVTKNKFSGTFSVDFKASSTKKEHLAQLVSSFVDKSSYLFSLKQGKKLKLELPLPDGSDENNLTYILGFLESLQKSV